MIFVRGKGNGDIRHPWLKAAFVLTKTRWVTAREINMKYFSKEQVIQSIKNSLYSVTVIEDNRAIAMGRLLGV